VRKRSTSPHEADEARATEPAPGESGPAAPELPRSEKAASPRPRAAPRRRAPKRNADKESAQGSLFEDLAAPPKAKADSARPQAEAEEQTEAKKSRSKRRRDRRKAAKLAEPRTAPKQPRDEPLPRESSGGREGQAPKKGDIPKGAPRPDIRRGPGPRVAGANPHSSRPRDAAAHQGKARIGPRSSEAFRERRQADGVSHRRGHPEGLPPLSLEDLDAVAQSGRGEGGIPRYGSDVRGHPRSAPAKLPDSARILEILSPSSESVAALAALEGVLDEAMPLQAKHRAALRGDIRKLWEELTSDRETRTAEYLGSPSALSAYLRYFLPWNVFRLTALLANADFCLPDHAVIVDIGSGPLTLPIALWIARPELREVPLSIYCVDRVERVLEAGINIFQTLCMRVDGRLPPWRIETRKDSFGSPLPERAHLLTAANVFNEFFWKDKRNLGERALNTARTLLSYLKENGSLFVMEPGDPRSGAFISALRAALLAEGAPPLGPCPHSLSCPMPGIFRHLLPPEETRTVKDDPNAAPSRYVLPPVVMPKKRDKFPWCHFGVDALKAPRWLEALSEEAGLPKERAVLSYLWAARGAVTRTPVGIPDPLRSSERERKARAGHGILVRVISESFALPDGSTGQYACSSIGYTLLKRPRGEEPFGSGSLLEVTSSPLQRNDEKSGATILPT
jgi:hypothetical protein